MGGGGSRICCVLHVEAANVVTEVSLQIAAAPPEAASYSAVSEPTHPFE
jgi:hypothetical protein